MANYYFGAPTSGNGDGSSGNPWSQAGFNAASFTASTDSLNVASGFTVSITAARANGTSITGDGNVVVTAIDQTPAADLSLITVAGTRIGDVAANTVFTGNFGTLTIAVGGGALLTSNSSILTGVSINGAGSVAVSDTVSVAQGINLGASISTSLAFSAGISDTLANLATGGSRTTALNAVLADDSDVVITISDASGTQQAADLSAVGSGTTGTVTVSNAQTVSGTADEVIAGVVTAASKVNLNSGSTLNASTYADQDLSDVAATFTLNVTTATGAVLDDVKLATADDITIGAGSATIDASTTDEVALAAKTTVNDGTTLTINNYVNTDLSGLSNQGTGSIVVNTTTGAVLDETKLADATSVVLGAEATGAASAIDGIGTNGGNINLNNQTLSVSSYTTENLSGIPSAGTLNVTTLDGAVLDATKLATADSVTLVGTNTATAADADALGSRLGGTATLNITTDTITANTDLSDLGSGLILQFGGDTTAAVDGATLTVRQDQVSGYTISGTGTVAAAGTAGADTFDASGITATTNFISLAGADSVTIAPSELSSVDVIDGGSDTDTLIFSAPASLVDGAFTNVSSVEILQLANGTNSVSLGSEAQQAGITTVTGSTGDDTLNLLYGNTGLTFTAGSGSDSLSYSADSAAQSITLSSVSSGTASGSVAGDGTDSFSGLEAIVGGSGTADSITSTSAGEALILTGANAGTIAGFVFSGVESVNLGDGDDSATVQTAGSLSGTLNLGGWNDMLSYAGYANPVSATLSGANTLSSITAITGGVTSVESLTLSSNNDTLTVGSSGSLSGNVDFGAGSDTLSYAGNNNVITVSLDSATSTAAAGATGITGTTSGFETLIGGSGSSDTLNATSGANTLSVASDGVTTLDSSLTVSGFETINLGASNDSATFSGAFSGTVDLGDGGDTATINDGGSVTSLVGGAGIDTLNLDGAANSTTITGTGAGTSGGTTTFSGFETVNGLGGSDAFIVNDASSTTITLAGGEGTDSLSVAAGDTSANFLTISGSGSGTFGTVAFSGMETINLGSGGDTAAILSGGLLSGNLNFGAGTDTLNYASYGSAITVEFKTVVAGSGTTDTKGATGISGVVSGVENIIGSDFNDTLDDSAVNSTVVISGANSGTYNDITFSSIENLLMGGGVDVVTIASGGSISGEVALGGGSENSLTLDAGAGSIGSARGGSGNDSVTISGGSITGSLDLGDGTDSLSYAGYGSGISATLSGTNALSTITAIGGGVIGVETITLSSNNDTFTVADGGTLSGALDLGDGNDTLSYAGYTNPVTVSLNGATSTAAGGATGITGAVSGFESLVGGNGSDTLNAQDGANTLIVAANGTATLDSSLTVRGFETINLGDSDDTATINDGGSVANLAGGDGNDTLNLDSADNSITITGTGEGTTAGTSGGTTTFSGFETVNGLGGDDAFIVNEASSTTITLAGGEGIDSLSVAASDSTANSLAISGSGSGTLGTVAFSGMETINLGSGSDTVSLATQFSGTIDGGAGDSDVLNLNASANDVIFTSPGSGTWGSTTFSNFEVVNLLGGTDSLKISGTGSFTSVDGGADTDELSLNRDTSNDVVLVSSAGAGSISSGGTNIGSFTNFESIDLGSGSDTLTYASYGSAVSLTLDSISSGTGTTTTGGATGFSGAVSGFETVVGSGSSDTLIASATDNTLILTGANQGTVDGLSFSSFETIDLAAGNDSAQFTSGDSLSGTLAGGEGIDTLDYSAYGTAVVVNLATGTATATGGISGFETVLGSSGNDTITASTSGDVNLQGNGGNDTFNVTVAGLTSTDTIAGGDGSDRIVFTDAGTITDAQFTNVSSVETVTLTGASTISAGTEASQAGIATINTGNGATTVNSTAAGYDLTVNATSLGDGNSLTLTGNAATNDFTVTGLNGSVLASGTSGTLTINTVNAGDNAIGVTTGSGNTTITANGANDIVTVNADAMKDNTNLDINGSAVFTVNNLEANTDAAGSTGLVSLAYTDVNDSDASIITGSGATTVSGTTSGDTLTINATSLAQNTTLTTSGDAQQVVTNLVGDISATALTGTLTVTTADAADNGISISSGSNNTTITASGAGDTITVNADAMADNTVLDINGGATFSVSNLEANTDAAGTSGFVSLAYTDVTDDAASISTGSGAVSVSGTSGDTLTIDATALANDITLTLQGEATMVVTGLSGDLDANPQVAYSDDFSSLDGWVGGVLDSSNAYYGSFLGRYANGAKTNGQDTFKSFALAGQPATIRFDVHRIDSWDGDAFRAYVNDTVAFQTTFVQGQDINQQSGSTNGFSWTITPKDTRALRGFAGWDEQTATVTITVPGGLPSLKLGFGSGLNQPTDDESYGIDNLFISSTGGTLSGPLTITTADNTVDNDISIVTGSANTTITANGSGDTITVTADALLNDITLTQIGSADQVVTGLVGDINATDLTGTLTVTTADAADNGISITTGSNNTTITASGTDDIVTVNADQMADNTTLDIHGSATFTVSNLEANTDAAGSSGALSITFSNITDNEATLLSGSGNVVVDGGDISDTVTVTGLTTNNQTFNAQDSTSNFNITAGAGNQTITGSNTGNDSIDGGSGDDTLSYAGGNTIDLTITAFNAQAGGSTGQGTDTFSNIDNLIGSAGTDVLRGIEGESDEIATVNAANAGTFADVSNTGSFDFSSFEQLDLNAGNDVLAITGNGSLSSSADGGAGIDRLDYSAYAAGPVTVDLNTGTATAIAGDLIGTTGDSSFEDVYGSTESDTITGDDTANVIRGNGGNDTIFGLGGDDTIDGGDGTIGPDGNDLIVAGDGADLILGSAGNDFISGGGYAEEEGTYFAVGDESIDTLSYIGRNEGLDLSLTGTDEGTVQADAGSSLTVSTLTNTYSSAIGQQLITVPTNQVATDWTDTYGDIQNLVLTNRNDIVRFDVGDVNTGSVDAAGGNLDTLDYSSFGADSPVLVNLSNKDYSFDFDDNGIIDTTIGEITIVNGNSATNVMVSEASSQGGAGGVSGFEVVIGGAGDDAIVGNDANNLLVGNAGSDRIDGGAGDDTIYGGDGDDYITPGAGADLVIAGAGINTIAITSSDLAEDVFDVDSNGINTFKLEGDGTQTSTITAPTGPWNPGEQGIDLLDGGDPVVSGAVTTYDTIEGTASNDSYEFGGTAFKNIGSVDLGAGDDSVGTAASTKAIKVTYDGNTGTDSITLNFTFDQFAKLNAAGLYVADVQNFLDDASNTTFSSSQANFTAQNFEAGGVAVITPAVYNALQGDPAALTFNSAFGVRDSTISSGDDVTLAASALTTSTATALSAADIVSAFVQASGVKGSDAVSITSGGSITGTSTASQDAVALSRTVDDRADSVLSAYGLGTDRSSFTAGDDISLSLSGTVNADTTAEAVAFVAKANGTVEVAGSRDSSLAAAEALDLTITASGLQTVAATNVEGLAIAGLASRAYGIDDANLTDSARDSVQAGSDLNLQAAASSNNRVTAQTANNEALGAITLVNNGPAATDRFITSQTGANFPLINGDRVRFTSANGSVQADRDYYVLNAIPVTGEFQLSSEPDGSPVDVVATGTGSLQAYRPAVATADAISTVTGVDLNRTGAGLGGVQAGDALSLQATATDVITATATSVAGDATTGVFRLGGMDGLNLASEVSTVQALVDTVSFAGRGASLNLDATDTATLSAASTEGAALTEANIQVFGSKGSDSTAGDDLSLSANAELNLSGSANSTAGSAEARSGAGAGAGVSTASVSNVVPTASSFSVVTGLADGTQTAGTDLAVQARGATTLNATASTVSGAGTLGSLWTSASGDILATFDLNLDTTTDTPSFVGPQVLAAGQLVQLDAASAAATGLAADTDYAVKLLGFGAVDASDVGATANSITMPTGITYALNDAVRFRLNSTTAPNSADSRYGLALGTTYYVVNPTATTFQLSATPGGAVIDLIPDNLGPADQLVDADRFQLLTLPTAPGGTYSVATLNGNASDVSLTLPSVANAFAGSREADRTLNRSDSLNLAQVSGISGNDGLRGLIAGAQGAISAMASGVLNALARNTAGDATASAGLVAEGLSDTAISAGSAGTVNAEASITAVADAATTGDNALVDNALADLTITARGLSASNAANDISIGGDGDVQSTANLNGRSTASTVLGDSDALAALEATGLEALDDGFNATIGQQGAIRAAASIGSLAAPLIISALSSAEGDATAQAAATGVGILGSYDANAPAGFSSLQAGTSQGDISGAASADLQLGASATTGAASVTLADVPGTGRASITGIENMALTAGAGLSGVDASATGRASLLAQSVLSDASSQGNTSATGLFSSAGDALPVTFADNGRIAAIAQQSSFAQSISVNGNASSSLNNTSLGIGNATITISGDGSLDARALSQLDSRSQSVAGSASA